MSLEKIIEDLEDAQDCIENLRHVPEDAKSFIITKLDDLAGDIGELIDNYGDEIEDDENEDDM